MEPDNMAEFIYLALRKDDRLNPDGSHRGVHRKYFSWVVNADTLETANEKFRQRHNTAEVILVTKRDRHFFIIVYRSQWLVDLLETNLNELPDQGHRYMERHYDGEVHL